MANPFEGGLPPAAGEDDGPPPEALEAQMRAELAARDERPAASPAARRAASASDEDEDGGSAKTPLPELDALVARLPAEVRDTLDELFRARFVAVKKLPRKHFQAATRKAAASSGEGKG